MHPTESQTKPDSANPQSASHTVVGTASVIERKFTFSNGKIIQRPNLHYIASDVISEDGYVRVTFDATVELQHHVGNREDGAKSPPQKGFPTGLDLIHLKGSVDSGPYPASVAGVELNGREGFDEYFYSIDEVCRWIEVELVSIVAERIFQKARPFYTKYVQPDLGKVIKSMKKCFAPWKDNLEKDKATRTALYLQETSRKK